MQFRVFPDHDNHMAEYWARFGARFSKEAGRAKRTKWRGSALMAMWSLILAWHAIRSTFARGGR